MKIFLCILLMASPITGMAQTAVEGGYIVVRGAVKDCPEWTNRILDAVKIEDQTPITILEISGFSVVGLSHDQVEKELIKAIATNTGKRPESLSVDILASDAEYQIIVKEHYRSSLMLQKGVCPHKDTEGNEQRQKEMEEIRLLEISERIALMGIYNKSFKYVTPASWLHRTQLRCAA